MLNTQKESLEESLQRQKESLVSGNPDGTHAKKRDFYSAYFAIEH